MQIRPLRQGFGAEIAGFDMQDGRSPDDLSRLRSAYAEHHLLIFRDGGPIMPERHVEIAGWFGPIGAYDDEEGRSWTTLHNDHATGSAILPFHVDVSFFPHPIEGLSLYPLELPNGPTSTTFASNALGWDAIPPALQDDLRTRRGRHFYEGSHTLDMDWPVLEHWHPLCMPHAVTGRPMLYATEHHVDRIEGLDAAHGAHVLEQLFERLYAPERTYEHVWQDGDLLIWDNFAVQHARTRVAEPGAGPRCMRRVAMASHGFHEQLEEARRRQGVTGGGSIDGY